MYVDLPKNLQHIKDNLHKAKHTLLNCQHKIQLNNGKGHI